MVAKKIRKVLIANRAEIALRVVRACRELGIESVLAHSEADANSLPAKLADRAVCIGGAAAGTSYLSKERLVGAAVAFGVDAIHPGYGFLAENAAFAELCRQQGITFIGPSAEVIRAMGDKIEARKIAAAAGVPTIPGSDGAVADATVARDIAEAIGYPILVKAAAGGGGRGMRVIQSRSELNRGLSEAMGEAQTAFGDASVYIEKYMIDIRHLEVQVLGDGTHIIHLGERDCSSQRRNQKLVEEAPCVSISDATRSALCAAAIDLCRRVAYKSAGTVEFVYDNSQERFYFIEMNTRIQVEHPVTEMITGVDLVKEQIRIAGGEALRLRQEDIRLSGHAIECRINAEDPAHDFRPSPGLVTEYLPAGGPGIRVDSHLQRGYVISPFYDSLIAKLISWGNDRAEAIDRMLRALGEMRIEGVSTTLALQRRILESARFRSGDVNTRLVSELMTASSSIQSTSTESAAAAQ
jgi:acetyl-CoA carboxylase biotin carboxylase subunit